MKRLVSDRLPKWVTHGGNNGGARVLGGRGLVQLAWLPGAGHTAWVSDWPPPVRIECEEIFGALRPRCAVEIYVPNLDHAGRPIDAHRFVDELRHEITTVTGGQTSHRTEGDFRPAGTEGLTECTVVLKTLLPTVVNDALRLWLVDLLIRFGQTATQDVVQVEIASLGYWIHTGLLRNGVDDSSNGVHGNPSSRRARRACSTAS